MDLTGFIHQALMKDVARPSPRISLPSIHLQPTIAHQDLNYPSWPRVPFSSDYSLHRESLPLLSIPIASTMSVQTRTSQILKPRLHSNSFVVNLILENQLLKKSIQNLAPQNSSLIKPESKVNLKETTDKSRPAEPARAAETQLTKTNGKANSIAGEISPSNDGNPVKLKIKRVRRLAKHIERTHCCPIAGCGKSYGSEGSLHQHVRLKHQDFDLTGWIREKIKMLNH